jgi:TRAP-type C4-dicarboxylate transport system permease small subunit
MRRLIDSVYLAAGVAAGLFLVAIFALMVIMSAGRQFGLNVPAGDDFAAWCMAATAFLGLAHTFKRGEMIRVGLLLERIEGRPRWLLEVLCLTVTAAFLAYFTWHAWRFVHFSWVSNEMSNGVVAVPMWIPQIGFLAGLALLTLAVFDELAIVASGRRATYEKDKPKSTEELLERVAEGGGV